MLALSDGPALSSFFWVLFVYLLHYSLCLRLAPLPGSSLIVGLGGAAKTKRNITSGCHPSNSSSGSRITPVGKSLKAKQELVELSLYQ